MESVADSICDYILNQEESDITEKELYVGERPASPTNCITFYDNGGPPPPKDTTVIVTVQAMTRNENYPLAYSKSYDVYDILRERYCFWLIEKSVWAVSMEAQNEPGFVGREDDDSVLFSSSFNLNLKYY